MAYPATPKTWVAGDVLTASQLNAELRDALLAIFPLGPPDVAWTAWTPTLTQSGAVTKTINWAKYTKVGRQVTAVIDLTVTGSGTAGNAANFSLPVTSATPGGAVIGSMMIYNSSGPFRYNGSAELLTTTTVQLSYNVASATGWGASPNIGLATGDIVRAMVTYESAS